MPSSNEALISVKVLGSISSRPSFSYFSSLLVDKHTLIDCGAGITTLNTTALLNIRHIFLSSSQIKQCTFLPFLANIHIKHAGKGFCIYGRSETLHILKEHLFNGLLAPDCMTCQTTAHTPLLRFKPLEAGDTFSLKRYIITALPAYSESPSLSWLIEGPLRALAFSTDGGQCASFWHWLNQVPSLTDIICELPLVEKQPAFLPPQTLPANSLLWVTHAHTDHQQGLVAKLRNTLTIKNSIEVLKEGQQLML